MTTTTEKYTDNEHTYVHQTTKLPIIQMVPSHTHSLTRKYAHIQTGMHKHICALALYATHVVCPTKESMMVLSRGRSPEVPQCSDQIPEQKEGKGRNTNF